MDEATPQPLPFSGKLARFLVSGLPFGLVLMGVLSFVIFFHKRNAPQRAASELAVMFQRELNAADFERHLRVLTGTIGPRTPDQPENLTAASAFIESTMGFSNMGYEVRRGKPARQSGDRMHLVADLTGKGTGRQVVLVVAAYGSGEKDAAGMAALMCLAHAMTGQPLPSVVRFVAAPEFAADALASDALVNEGELRHLVLLNAPEAMEPLPEAWQNAAVSRFAMEASGDAATTVARLQELKSLVSKLAGGD